MIIDHKGTREINPVHHIRNDRDRLYMCKLCLSWWRGFHIEMVVQHTKHYIGELQNGFKDYVKNR